MGKLKYLSFINFELAQKKVSKSRYLAIISFYAFSEISKFSKIVSLKLLESNLCIRLLLIITTLVFTCSERKV